MALQGGDACKRGFGKGGPESVQIRELTEADAPIYWPLRLRGLREDPEAFGSSYTESKDRPLEQTVERLRSGRAQGDFTLGAFTDDANSADGADGAGERLVGMVTFVRAPGLKNRHNADIFGMYVAPEARGQGVGRALVEALIARARALDGVEQLILAVTASNTAARALYRALGFTVYGLHPHALRLEDGRYLDEELMILRL